jgi:hypothetical protein
MMKFLRTKVKMIDIPGIAPMSMTFRDSGCRRYRKIATIEIIPSANRLSGLKVAARAATEIATAISIVDHVKNESSR